MYLGHTYLVFEDLEFFAVFNLLTRSIIPSTGQADAANAIEHCVSNWYPYGDSIKYMYMYQEVGLASEVRHDHIKSAPYDA